MFTTLIFYLLLLVFLLFIFFCDDSKISLHVISFYSFILILARMKFLALLALPLTYAVARKSEILSENEQIAMGIVMRGNHTEQSSHEFLDVSPPASYNWCDVDGKSYCTVSLNQHIPQCKTNFIFSLFNPFSLLIIFFLSPSFFLF